MKYRVRFRGLPLMIYREVAAHLCQVEGVRVELVPQQACEFHYNQSQIDSVWIQYPDAAPAEVPARIQQILTYYSDRYGNMETATV